MVCRVGDGRSLKHAFVLNQLSTRSHASSHACRPVEHNTIARTLDERTLKIVTARKQPYATHSCLNNFGPPCTNQIES
ncbi:hypothetical protein Y032_0255g330 [Ancylostoma ceylanicum]|nr:hypothetical protein Y032_0255g330 [Ancylostoma ceylanicum]